MIFHSNFSHPKKNYWHLLCLYPPYAPIDPFLLNIDEKECVLHDSTRWSTIAPCVTATCCTTATLHCSIWLCSRDSLPFVAKQHVFQKYLSNTNNKYTNSIGPRSSLTLHPCYSSQRNKPSLSIIDQVNLDLSLLTNADLCLVDSHQAWLHLCWLNVELQQCPNDFNHVQRQHCSRATTSVRPNLGQIEAGSAVSWPGFFPRGGPQ